ncbi:hypothetical protein DIPPA_03155 [Diplonema papillatum]|nr:hypothetical protein DIPPA_03155 [Diplonema papillatum]
MPVAELVEAAETLAKQEVSATLTRELSETREMRRRYEEEIDAVREQMGVVRACNEQLAAELRARTDPQQAAHSLRLHAEAEAEQRHASRAKAADAEIHGLTCIVHQLHAQVQELEEERSRQLQETSQAVHDAAEGPAEQLYRGHGSLRAHGATTCARRSSTG